MTQHPIDEKLLPCPLCNGEMVFDQFVDWEGQPLPNQVIIHPSPSECPLSDIQIDATPEAVSAWNRRATTPDQAGEMEVVAWIELREPGCVPDRKGPFRANLLKATLREVFRHRPKAYVTVITIDDAGVPSLQDGPECLQMLDGRSMSTGRKAIAANRAAHGDHDALSQASSILAAKEAEIERLTEDRDAGVRNLLIMQSAANKLRIRAEAAESELAQWQAWAEGLTPAEIAAGQNRLAARLREAEEAADEALRFITNIDNAHPAVRKLRAFLKGSSNRKGE